jgi:hypothetical protein
VADRPNHHVEGTGEKSPGRIGNTHADRIVWSYVELMINTPNLTRRNGVARRSLPRKVTYFEPVPPRLARNTIIEATSRSVAAFAARCVSILASSIPARWSCRYPAHGTLVCPSASTKRSWRTGALRSAVYQLAALTIGARLAVADG